MQVHAHRHHYCVLRPANLAQRTSLALQKKKPVAQFAERVQAQARPRA
jgi:hypothetical protein